VDERAPAAGDPKVQADLLEELLAHLGLMEHPEVVFKFFLPKDTHQILSQRRAVRKDRLIEKAVTVEWSPKKLKELLNERLRCFSDGEVPDLKVICTKPSPDSADQDDTAAWLETNLIDEAGGSPRRLISAGKFLFEVYVSRPNSDLIVKSDWEMAQAQLRAQMGLPQPLDGHKALPAPLATAAPQAPSQPLSTNIPLNAEQSTDTPTLYISRKRREIKLNRQVTELTSLEHKIFLTLAKNDGFCQREKLVDCVWEAGSGVSDQAVDACMARIRKKIEQIGGVPAQYLKVREKAITLSHFQVYEDTPTT
jgi:hypothetical protein